jgi:hypothetical protein
MSVFQTPCNYPGVLPATFFSICRRILLDMFGKVVKGISGRVNICSINHLRGTYSWFFYVCQFVALVVEYDDIVILE